MFAQLHIIYAGSLNHDFQMNFLRPNVVDPRFNMEVWCLAGPVFMASLSDFIFLS